MRNIKIKDISENYDKIASPNPNARLRPSIGLDESVGEFFYLKVNHLRTYDKQARKHFDLEELNRLADTIHEHGIRQPLSIIKTEEPGVYQVISGERRLRAAKIAGFEKVPCIILSDASKAEEIAVIENIQRADLHPVELSEAYLSLLKNFNHGDKSKLAKKLAVSNSHISEILSLSKLPEEIRELLVHKNIRARVILRKLVKCNDINQMKAHLGIDNASMKRENRRQILYTFFIENGEVSYKFNSYKLTEKQKAKIKEYFSKIIQEFKN